MQEIVKNNPEPCLGSEFPNHLLDLFKKYSLKNWMRIITN